MKNQRLKEVNGYYILFHYFTILNYVGPQFLKQMAQL